MYLYFIFKIKMADKAFKNIKIYIKKYIICAVKQFGDKNLARIFYAEIY